MTTKLPAAFSPEVLAALARPYSPIDLNVAELTHRAPKWYVVEIRNRDVEAELIKRRFGIYVPEFDEMFIVRGRKVERRMPLVAGYVFVFLWETDANWQRVTTTPGVVSILGWLADDEIDRLRQTENGERLDARGRARLKQRLLRKVQPMPKRKKGRRVKRRGKASAAA